LALLVFLFHLTLSLYASVHILLYRRQPRTAMLWLLWVWLLPVAGFFLYFSFGFNRVGRPPHRPLPADRENGTPLESLSAAVSGRPLRGGNRVKMLQDGTEGYPAMLSAIRHAQRSIDLQSYIFDLDEVGESVLKALEDASRRGLRVRVLVDGLAAWSARRPLKRRLRLAGGEARSYWRWNRAFGQPLLNLRNHRKLLVVDSTLAFTGGLNVSRRYAKGAWSRLRELPAALAGTYPSVRDLHFALTGPVVKDLDRCFEDDWAHSGGGGPKLPRTKPAQLRIRGGSDHVRARVIRSGPDEDLERFYEVLLGALSLARHRVDLSTPYFIPDAPLMALLRVLGYRGVKVRLHLPKETDQSFMTWATREYYDDLLDAGVELWEVDPPFVHTKLAVVDSKWVAFGSSNLDNRSFRLNFELNVEAHSTSLASRAEALLETYRHGASPVLRNRKGKEDVWPRLRGAIVNLAAPYL
jgi:cardiolipin synthase